MSKKTTKTKTAEDTSKYYFTEETENWIVEYNNETDIVRRNQIYKDYIEKPIKEIISFYANSFARHYIEQSVEEAKDDALAHYHTIVHHYKKEKAKAYSYFSVIIKNYFIRRNALIYKSLVAGELLDAVDNERNIMYEVQESETDEIKADFVPMFLSYLELHIDKLFIYEGEAEVCDTFILFLRNGTSYEDYNKKQLYHLIKERTDVKTICITRTLKKIAKMYAMALREYKEKDSLKSLNPNILLTKTRQIT